VEIQKSLQHRQSSNSRRRLRQIVVCGDVASQLRKRQELVHECHILALK